MGELPKHLRQEMAIFLHKGVLEKMAIFQKCSVPFLSSILMRVRSPRPRPPAAAGGSDPSCAGLGERRRLGDAWPPAAGGGAESIIPYSS